METLRARNRLIDQLAMGGWRSTSQLAAAVDIDDDWADEELRAMATDGIALARRATSNDTDG